MTLLLMGRTRLNIHLVLLLCLFLYNQTHLRHMRTVGIPHDTMVAILFQNSKKALMFAVTSQLCGS